MRAEPHQKVQLRKAYWNIGFDKLLWDNAVALNLLYIETIAELKNGHIKPTEEAADQLAEFRSNRDRKAFLQLAREQDGYGFAKFGECTVNYPEVRRIVLWKKVWRETGRLGRVMASKACLNMKRTYFSFPARHSS